MPIIVQQYHAFHIIIVYCHLDQGTNFVLQKVQCDAAGKLSVTSSSTVYFPIIKSHHPVLKEKTK